MIDNDGRQDGVRRDDAGEVIARAWGAIQHLLRNLYDLPNDRSLLSSEDILKELHANLLAAEAKLRHRCQVQRHLVEHLHSKCGRVIQERHMPWVGQWHPSPLDTQGDVKGAHNDGANGDHKDDDDEAKDSWTIPLSAQIQRLQSDLAALADVVTGLTRDFEDVQAKWRELREFVGDDQSDQIITCSGEVLTCDHLNQVHALYQDLLLKIEGDGRRVEQQRTELGALIRDLDYVSTNDGNNNDSSGNSGSKNSSNEQLLCTLLMQSAVVAPIPAPLHRDLVRLALRLRKLGKERSQVIDRLLWERQDLMHWLDIDEGKASTYNGSGGKLSGKYIAWLERQVEGLRQEQVRQCDAVHDRKLATLLEYCQALSEPMGIDSRTADMTTSDKLRVIAEIDGRLEQLRPKYEASAAIRSLIRKRHDLVQEMKAFEVTASDPRRLFQPSFRLVQEERFRKTAVPTLLKLEQRLMDELRQWPGGAFPYEGHEDYQAALQADIAGRYVNETVFGFSQSSNSHAHNQNRNGGNSPIPRPSKSLSSSATSTASTSTVTTSALLKPTTTKKVMK